MKTIYIMYCEDEGEYELWFDENKKLIGGYSCNDASWRDEYLGPIFKVSGINVESLKYNKKLAKESRKKLWGF